MDRQELQAAEHRYRCSAQAAEDLRRERNAAVQTALSDGWTHARISEATGLTRTRIGQIALQPRQPAANAR